MKFLVSVLVTIVVLVSNTVTAQEKVTVTITVENATSDAGKIGYALYNKETFLKKPLQAMNATIENGKSVAIFKDLEAGEYAVICYHDKNDNDRMDFAANGMPLEDYGATNNVMSFGPPNFEDAKFVISDKNVSLKIRF